MVNADHLYGADAHWWHYSIGDINCGFTGKRWSCENPEPSNWNGRDPKEWNIEVLTCLQNRGLARERGFVHSGGNSGYQAINLAYSHLNATRIILIGFDLSWTGGKSHFFGDHGEGLINARPNKYIPRFRTIKPEEYGIEIINCTRHTLLDAFPCRALEDVF